MGGGWGGRMGEWVGGTMDSPVTNKTGTVHLSRKLVNLDIFTSKVKKLNDDS